MLYLSGPHFELKGIGFSKYFFSISITAANLALYESITFLLPILFHLSV